MADVKASPTADPGPLGLSAFALTTFVLSVVNAGLVKESDTPIVIGLAFFYGGLAQLLAGMWEFRNGNTFGATAFSSYGAFWLSFAALLIPGFGVVLEKNQANTAIGIYLLAWTIVTGLLMLGAFRVNGALSAVFILLFVTFLLLTIGKLAGNASIGNIGGWVGILTAIVAWYTALAGILRDVSKGRVALPVFPMSA